MEGHNIHNLQGLLRFALQHTRSEDAPNPSAFQEMDPERRQFLENVLRSMSVDVIEEFRKAIEILESEDSSVDEKMNALDLIREYVDNIDFANNFVKIGGSAIIISCLNSENTKIRASSAQLIAELTQNNPFCQRHFTEKDILPKLIHLLTDDEEVACSALYAISCLVRHYEQALAAFIELGGIGCILACLTDNHYSKLFVKACFLLNALSTEFPIIRDEFLKWDIFEKLSTFVVPSEQYDVELETVLSTLNTLSSSKGDRAPIITEELQIKLNDIVKKCENKDECREIVEYSKSLLDKSLDTEEDVEK